MGCGISRNQCVRCGWYDNDLLPVTDKYVDNEVLVFRPENENFGYRSDQIVDFTHEETLEVQFDLVEQLIGIVPFGWNLTVKFTFALEYEYQGDKRSENQTKTSLVQLRVVKEQVEEGKGTISVAVSTLVIVAVTLSLFMLLAVIVLIVLRAKVRKSQEWLPLENIQ
jgi:hypothetical protein